MKKPVLIIIAIIYIMALVIVGLLGIPAKVVAPKVWTSDIELTFDDKLMPLKATEEIPYRYRFNTSVKEDFTITAKALPDDASFKESKVMDLTMDKSYYTLTTEFKNNVTVITVECEPVITTSIISLKILPTDGNEELFKRVDVVVTNI